MTKEEQIEQAFREWYAKHEAIWAEFLAKKKAIEEQED